MNVRLHDTLPASSAYREAAPHDLFPTAGLFEDDELFDELFENVATLPFVTVFPGERK